MTMRASSSCGAAALSTVRPGSSKSSAQNVQFHRRGTRSAAARLRRTAARLTRFAAPAAQAAEADSESDFAEILDFCQDDQGPSTPGAPTAACGPGPSSGDLFARGDGSLRGAFGTIFNVESCSPRAGDDNANVSVSPRDGPGDNSSHGRIGQSSPSTPSISDNFTVFHLNVRGLRENRAVFDAFLSTLGKPTFVAVTETWLDKTTETLDITGYHRVSRLDRRGRARSDRGGVALYALDGFELTIVHVGDSTTDERSWHVIHSDSGPVLLCVVQTSDVRRGRVYQTF